MKVKDIMTSKVATVRPADSLKQAAESMVARHCGSLPVLDGRKIVGIVTDRDMTTKAIAQGKGPNTPVKDVMTSDVITISPNTEGDEAADLMAHKKIRRLPVMEQGQLVGIVAIGDLARVDIFAHETGDALSDISKPSQHANAVQ